MENAYDQGYEDGFKRRVCSPNPNSKFLNMKYMLGYNKGQEDRKFVDYYSDEALGVNDYGA